jgi:2,3-bisphosphoglycerate-independent phosphoglycerate mutase
MAHERPRPLTLIILDGWGYREEKESNAIAAAHKPNWDHIWNTYPHTLLSGSGSCVGLPDGQMGNSEVGHMNMGAGRIVHQDLTRIDLAIKHGEFFNQAILVNAFNQAKQTNKAVHVLGLLSAGGVHSHEQHVHALLKLAAQQQAKIVYIHAFLDGRDTPPKSALASLTALNAHCQQLQCGTIVSLIGRYYAMDRDQRWERVQCAYDLIAEGKALYHADTAEQGLELAYARGEHDEFVQATAIHAADEEPKQVQDGDVLIFMNFRADRARELTQAFTDPHFKGFFKERSVTPSEFICLTSYDPKFPLPVVFPPEPLDHILADCLSQAHLSQLRIAETEKYAHVTFFFNGGIETPFPGEKRILVPSPKVATYDLKPEMSAFELTEQLITVIKQQGADVIICNFANPDMVGHTGKLAATVKAIETIDDCLEKILKASLAVGGEILITADHGNAEQLFNLKTQQAHTAHTSNPVPFIYIGRKASILLNNGKLSDIAPTMLYLLGLAQPPEMTGKPLLKLG